MNPLTLLWSFDGRIGRSTYAGGLLLNYVVMFAAMAVMIHFALHWTLPESFNLKDGSQLAAFLVAVFFYWANFALTVKRLRDLDATGLLSLLLLIPLVGLILVIILLFARGEDSDNPSGPDARSARAPAPAHHA
jgi:uncharacterized membrane protein YhaH (DUF805 family)